MDTGLKKFKIAIVASLCFVSLSTAVGGAEKPRGKFTSEVNATKQNLLLTAGSQTNLDLNFQPCKNTEQCVKITNPALMKVDYSEDKNQLVFSPTKQGETTVTVRDKDGTIRLILKTIVTSSNLSRRLDELKRLLRDVEGLDIFIEGDKIVVDGDVVTVTDLNRVYTVLNDESYKGFILPLFGLSPIGQQLLADKMQSEIGNPNVKVRVVNSLFWLEGQVDCDSSEGKVAREVATNMVQGFLLPSLSLEGARNPYDVKKSTTRDPIVTRFTCAKKKAPPGPKMIRLTVDFVELSKDYARNFGFNWSPSLDTGGSLSFGQSTTGGITTQGSGSLSGTISQLFPKLASAQNAGYARILEESVLIVKDGRETALDRTTEIPIQTVNAQGQPTFVKVNIGPAIKITPKTGQNDEIDLTVDFSYKGLVGKQGSGNSAPVIQNHSYKGDVIIRSSESAALVNAISNAIITDFNKDAPGGTPTNPLFNLLRSKAFQKNKSQFVIFLTPQVIESASNGTEDIKGKYGLKRKL